MKLIKYAPSLFDMVNVAKMLKVPEHLIPDFLSEWKKQSENPSIKYVVGFNDHKRPCALLELRQMPEDRPEGEADWIVSSSGGEVGDCVFLIKKFAKKFDVKVIDFWADKEVEGMKVLIRRYGLRYERMEEQPTLFPVAPESVVETITAPEVAQLVVAPTTEAEEVQSDVSQS